MLAEAHHQHPATSTVWLPLLAQKRNTNLGNRRTSCPFARSVSVVTCVLNGPVLGHGRTRTISVRSPVTRRSYRLRLMRRLDHVTANGPNGIWMRFFYEF
jgi:hypothetical protein